MDERTPQRLAGEFREKIERGEWAVGARLPTNRELASTYRVSVNSVQTAFRELEADELVERRPRVGGFVKSRYPRSSGLRTATTVAVVGGQGLDVEIAAAQQRGQAPGFAYRIVHGLANEIAASAFHVSTFTYLQEDTANALARVLEKVDQAGDTLAGVLCFLNEAVAGVRSELDRRNIPWVTVNRPDEHAIHNFVAHNAFRGARILARCYARMGFDRVAVLSDALGMGRSTGDKFHGFLDGWIEGGMSTHDVGFVHCPTFHEEVGHDNFLAYVKKYGPPRGVFTSGDFLALGTLRACRELGLAVPEQVAVTGSTGLDVATYSHPSLTVLDTPMEQIGANAGQMLLEMAREGVRRMSGRYVKANIISRESCPIPADLLAQEEAAVDQTS